MVNSWRICAHVCLILLMTYHAIEVDTNLLPYARGLFTELWRLLHGKDTVRPAELFTMNQTIQHGHTIVANYFDLPEVALGQFQVAINETVGIQKDYIHDEHISLPLLTVVYANPDNPDQEMMRAYVIHQSNEYSWPEGLRRNCTSECRKFFDTLKWMTLSLELKSHIPSKRAVQHERKRAFMRWNVSFVYDFSNQGQILLDMNLQRLLPDNNVFYSERTPKDYYGRYTFIIFLALLCIFIEAWELFQSSLRDSWRQVLEYHSSGIIVLVLNFSTIIYFVHEWRITSALVYVEPLNGLFAFACAGQWIMILRYLSVNPRCYILGLTLRRGLPQVLEFLIGVCPLFIGYVLFGTIMFGTTVHRFEGMAATATTLFAIANGDEIRDTFESLPWLGQIYLYTYIVLFAYVVLMVCIGIMEDSFFTSAFPTLWKKKVISNDDWLYINELIQNETKQNYPEFQHIQTEILKRIQRKLSE